MNSVRNRLALVFFVITAAAVGFIYLYVVPQLRSSLTAEKLRRLETVATTQSGALEDAMRAGASQQRVLALVRGIDQRTGARVTVLGVRSGVSGDRARIRGRRLGARAHRRCPGLPLGRERRGGRAHGERDRGRWRRAPRRNRGSADRDGRARWIAVFSTGSPTSTTTSP